jgi:hypothetical protein
MAAAPIAVRGFAVPAGLGLLCVALVVLVLVEPPAPVRAGPPARDDTGFFVKLEVGAFARGAHTRRHRRGAGLEIDYVTGNDLTSEAPSGGNVLARTEFRAAKGFVVNHRAFPICRMAVLAERGPSACPRNSRVGRGTVLIDARPLFPVFPSARIVVVNTTWAFSPAIAIWAKTLYGQVSVVRWEIRPPRGGFGPSVVNPPGTKKFTVPEIQLYFRELHLVISGRPVRHGRRSVHYLETTTACRGSRLFQLVNTKASGESLVAADAAPCARR